MIWAHYTPDFNLYVYLLKLFSMTVKLNLTIDENIVVKSKRYAAKKKTTVSKLVQELLKKQLELEGKKPKQKSFVQKWAGTFSGQLSDSRIKEIKDQHLNKKYGY